MNNNANKSINRERIFQIAKYITLLILIKINIKRMNKLILNLILN